MMHSGITARAFIEDIKGELGIVPPVADSRFVQWLLALEQLIYSEIVAEERLAILTPHEGKIDLSDIAVAAGESAPTADDVAALFVDGAQIPRVGVALYHTLYADDAAYIKENDTTLALTPLLDTAQEVAVVYHARPAMKGMVEGVVCEDEVALPAWFLDMAGAKLRGEAYRLAEDDAAAERWLADFNHRLDQFREWAKLRDKVKKL